MNRINVLVLETISVYGMNTLTNLTLMRLFVRFEVDGSMFVTLYFFGEGKISGHYTCGQGKITCSSILVRHRGHGVGPLC